MRKYCAAGCPFATTPGTISGYFRIPNHSIANQGIKSVSFMRRYSRIAAKDGFPRVVCEVAD
jgi:hypothetical protein